MISKDKITALILAGGKSSRMGRDKGQILWKNKTFVQHIIDQAAPLCSNTIIAANDPYYTTLGFPVIQDEMDGEGPLHGLINGMEHSKTELILALSCDQPKLNTEVLSKLLENPLTSDLRCFKVGDKIQPLTALYHSKTAKTLTSQFNQGERSVFRAMQSLSVEYIEVDVSDLPYFSNINRPEDLSNL